MSFPRTLLPACLTVIPLAAQTLSFDAASIKPSAQVGGWIRPIKTADPGRVTYRTYSAIELIGEAFQLSRYQIKGVKPSDRNRYDITATHSRGASEDDIRAMLRNLLAERFGFRYHDAMEPMAAYVLLPGKDRSLLRPATKKLKPVAGCNSFGTMDQYAKMLSAVLGGPVVNQTGIEGAYIFFLVRSSAASAAAVAAGPGAPPPPPPPAPAPPPCPGWTADTMPPPAATPIEAVREQMGLRLERRGNTPVKVIVIDGIGKATEN